ncbi:MAG: TIGR02147 family protein [Myxococcales bacterium]|nr:TIGR02147 family protein [Myxococcales bacterium]
MNDPAAVDVFEYTNLRAFLRDVYDAKKSRNRGFSYRAFSRRAGLRSPNHLKRIIDGERTLTAETALRYCSALGLQHAAADYFCDLAAQARATTPEERQQVQRRLAGRRRHHEARHLDFHQTALQGRWYVPAIREMVLRADFREDPEWIASQLVAPIDPADVREALDLLLSSGLLERQGSTLIQGSPVVVSRGQTDTAHTHVLHRSMMQQAIRSLDEAPPDQRDISCLTMCVGTVSIDELKELVRKFRQDLVALTATESEGTQVVQLNIQLFPLSHPSAD